jgi:hypothetical protein
MKFTYYHTVVESSFAQLDRAVTKLMSEGWQPFGNPCVFSPPSKTESLDKMKISQAMVLDSEIASVKGKPEWL